MRAVVDTNVIMSGIFWAGTPGLVVRAWLLGEFDLMASHKILDEYLLILKRLGVKSTLDRFTLNSMEGHLLSKTVIMKPGYWAGFCRDPNDKMFLDLAASAMVDYLITGDDDLLSLKNKFPVPIVTPGKFIERTKKNGP